MIVFEPQLAKGFEYLVPINGEDYELLASLDGKSHGDGWRPIKVRTVRAEEQEALRTSDFPWLASQSLAMRPKAVATLGDILAAHGELLPLESDSGADLFAFNARTIDALDENRSSLIRFPDTGRIMHINQIALVETRVHEIDIFRLPHRASSTYVSERFVERAEVAGLVGLEFKRVWSC